MQTQPDPSSLFLSPYLRASVEEVLKAGRSLLHTQNPQPRDTCSPRLEGPAGGVGCIQSYPPPPLVLSRFMCDDVDFNLRVHSAGLLLCRFNRFSVMKKQIAVGGHRSFHITSKVRCGGVAAGWHPVSGGGPECWLRLARFRIISLGKGDVPSGSSPKPWF